MRMNVTLDSTNVTGIFSEKNHLSLLTDLYQLTMAAGYYNKGMNAPATFSLFIRTYPEHRSYFVSAGLEKVLEYLESFCFSGEEIVYLKSTNRFSKEFLEYLHSVRFTGDVVALREGTVFFTNEPVLEVTGPIIEAQLVESIVINFINLQTSIATKAARCVYASEGRSCIDFSLRRTQGTDAAMKVARASFIAGFSATSNVLAGWRYGIPISGTMAHSFVTSFEHELDAFRAFADTFPDEAVLLIDTYDTLQGARNAVAIGKELQAKGKKLQGVRLDSGDMVMLSKQVREILDGAGLHDVAIFASGNLDEYRIRKLVGAGAPIDGFGIGTKMGVVADAPSADIAYKLVEYAGRPVLKLSADKKTLAGKKQVFRVKKEGVLRHDCITLREERAKGTPLLQRVMSQGKRLASDDLSAIRNRCAAELESLDMRYKDIIGPEKFPVFLSEGLQEVQKKACSDVEKNLED